MKHKYEIYLDIDSNLKLESKGSIKNKKTFNFNDNYLLTVEIECLAERVRIKMNIYSKNHGEIISNYEDIIYNNGYTLFYSLNNLCRTYRMYSDKKEDFFIKIKTNKLIDELKCLSYMKMYTQNEIINTDFKKSFELIDLCSHISSIKNEIDENIGNMFIDKSAYYGHTDIKKFIENSSLNINAINDIIYTKTEDVADIEEKLHKMALLRIHLGLSIFDSKDFLQSLEIEYSKTKFIQNLEKAHSSTKLLQKEELFNVL